MAEVTVDSPLKQLSAVKCCGGTLTRYQHASSSTKTDMKFNVFLPANATATAAAAGAFDSGSGSKVPALYWLSGLTCTDENFAQKAGAFAHAAAAGLAIVMPDTSPRGVSVEGDSESWDFGTGAGFYVTATESKWKENYNMYDYVTKELIALCETHMPISSGSRGISGHSMGGHGALVCALKNPGLYQSVSAFAPICNPINCPWGVKAFTGYLGAGADTTEVWKQWDASELVKTYAGPAIKILVDQGEADDFYLKKQLLPESLQSTDTVAVTVRLQPGYDHSYYFIQSFIQEHVQHHAAILLKKK
jgi:S-formylglutathione hydrolase